METYIQNRDKIKIFVRIDNPTGVKGLVFIAHGLSGNSEEACIQTYAEAFLQTGYVVVRWDAAHTLGKSGGSLIRATLTSYYDDMEDVISWSKSQKWYREPFVLVGHSLGSACAILYASEYPEKVRALIPTSAYLSWETYASYLGPRVVSAWEQDGYMEVNSESKPGLVKRYGWELAADMQHHGELLHFADQIFIPVLMIVGSKDTGTPPSNQKLFIGRLPNQNGSLHIIPGAGHTFYKEEHLQKIKHIILTWLSERFHTV